MSLILAVEPDRRQAANLTQIVRQRVGAELILAETTELALAQIGNRVPDLILVPALLSPQDDAALAAALRVIATAAHVQMLTTPLFASTVAAPRAGGMLSVFRRSKAKPSTDGCDPAEFAQQISSYLQAAAEQRASAQFIEPPVIPSATTAAPAAAESSNRYIPLAPGRLYREETGPAHREEAAPLYREETEPLYREVETAPQMEAFQEATVTLQESEPTAEIVEPLGAVEAAQLLDPPAIYEEPEALSETPIAETIEPVAELTKPIFEASAPILEASEPEAIEVPEPIFAAPDPALQTPQSILLETSEPMLEAREAMRFEAPEPILEAPEPILLAAPEPILEAPEPMLFETPEPILEAPEPILLDAPEPIVLDAPQPIFVAPEPVLLEAAEPAFHPAEPTLELADPVLEAPEPILEAPEPIIEAIPLAAAESTYSRRIGFVIQNEDAEPERAPLIAAESPFASIDTALELDATVEPESFAMLSEPALDEEAIELEVVVDDEQDDGAIDLSSDFAEFSRLQSVPTFDDVVQAVTPDRLEADAAVEIEDVELLEMPAIVEAIEPAAPLARVVQTDALKEFAAAVEAMTAASGRALDVPGEAATAQPIDFDELFPPREPVEPSPLGAWYSWRPIEGMMAEAMAEAIDAPMPAHVVERAVERAAEQAPERPEWVQLVESLRLDVERRRSEQPSSAPKAPRKAPSRPVQDEWGLFDPAQCGFAALLDKLDEITDANESRPRRSA